MLNAVFWKNAASRRQPAAFVHAREDGTIYPTSTLNSQFVLDNVRGSESRDAMQTLMQNQELDS
jgi:hypothetical protein